MYDIKYIHNFLKDSSVPMEASLPITTTVSTTFQPSSNTLIPSAMAAMGHRQNIDKNPPTPTQYRRNNTQFRSKQNFHKCIICFGRHQEVNCIHCGDDWKPKWIIKNAVKYNATHPTQKTNPDIVNADPPLVRATNKYQTNAAIIENENDIDYIQNDTNSINEEEVADDLILETDPSQIEEILPSAGMANKNYQELKDNRFALFEDSSSSNGEEEF